MANGAQASKTDQRGVVHTYVYDAVSRLTDDQVTSLGASSEHVDGTVPAIVTAYDEAGRTASVTSYDSPTARDAGDVVNQVAYQYDAWGNVAQSAQAHAGAATGGTPAVQYGYDGLSRLTSVAYPTTRNVGYSYGEAGSLDNGLSRVAAITDATLGGAVAQYTYLGADTIVNTAHPQVTGDLTLRLDTMDNGYACPDQFGRVVDHLWTDGDVKGIFFY